MWNQTTELRPTTTMKMSNFRPEGGTCQIYEGRQHTEPEPGCAASSDTRNRRCEAEQALPGSRERIHLLTESVMKHQLLLEGVTTELTGLQKGIGSTRNQAHEMLFLTTAHSGPEGLSRHIAGGWERILRECYHMFISFLSFPLEADTALGPWLKAREASWCNPVLCFLLRDRIKIQIHHPDINNQVIPVQDPSLAWYNFCTPASAPQ